MKRLRASTAGLLALILVIASAHVVSELWVVQWMTGRYNIVLSQGTLSVDRIEVAVGGLAPPGLHTYPIREGLPEPAPRRWLPAFRTPPGWVLAAMPLWIVELPLVALTIVQFRRIRTMRGRCRHCGYDRKGLAPNSVCPECGRSEPDHRQKR